MASITLAPRRKTAIKSTHVTPAKETVASGPKASPKRIPSLDAHLEKRVLGGLRWAEVGALAKSLGLSLSDLARYAGLSASTFFSRKGSRFDSIESDRLIRFERLFALAVKAMGDAAGAAEWLKMPQVGLAGEIPLEKAKTEAGARQVETLLQRIDYGLA